MKVKQLREILADVRVDEEWDVQIGAPTGIFPVKSVCFFTNAKALSINVISEQQVDEIVSAIKSQAIKEKLKANIQ